MWSFKKFGWIENELTTRSKSLERKQPSWAEVEAPSSLSEGKQRAGARRLLKKWSPCGRFFSYQLLVIIATCSYWVINWKPSLFLQVATLYVLSHSKISSFISSVFFLPLNSASIRFPLLIPVPVAIHFPVLNSECLFPGFPDIHFKLSSMKVVRIKV